MKNLTSLSHIRQYGVASVLQSDVETSELFDALKVVQYHYQALNANDQEFVPYQVLVVAPLVNETMYMMPNTWLYSQEQARRDGPS